MLSNREIFLLAALGGVVALWWWSRTQQGAQAVSDATDTTLDFVDIQVSRVQNAIMSRGYRNNNPGNIRYIASNAWNGQIANDGGYGVYDTPENGTRAMGKQLLKYYAQGIRTVDGIVSTWAPASENNVAAYRKDVANQLGVDPYAQLNVPAMLSDIAQAMAKHENGYIDSDYDWQWVYLP